MKALLIAADPAKTHFVTLALQARWPDLSLSRASTGVQGVSLVDELSPDLILLVPDFTDIGLSTAILGIRQSNNAPLLVLGCYGDEMEAVNALASGADDYVRLPCRLAELTLRMWSVMRRTSMTSNHQNGAAPLRSGQLLLNLATHQAFLGDQPIHLSATEFRLLHILVKNRSSVVAHQTLENALWQEAPNSHGLVKKYIQRLRQKLGDRANAPHWIASVHSIGYRFIGPVSNNGYGALDPTSEAAPEHLAAVPACAYSYRARASQATVSQTLPSH